MHRQQCLQQRTQAIEPEGVGAVGLGVGRVVVDLQKQAIDSGGDGGAGEQRDELRLAAADAVGGRGLLHGVGAVEDHRRKAAQDGQ
jgi:hypothetical protein